MVTDKSFNMLTDSRHYVYRMKTVDSLAILGQLSFISPPY